MDHVYVVISYNKLIEIYNKQEEAEKHATEQNSYLVFKREVKQFYSPDEEKFESVDIWKAHKEEKIIHCEHLGKNTIFCKGEWYISVSKEYSLSTISREHAISLLS